MVVLVLILEAWSWLTTQTPATLAFLGDAMIALGAIVGVLLTGSIAVGQLRAQRRESAANRALELRKELMVEGIRGGIRLLQVFGRANNVELEPAVIQQHAQESLTALLTASSMSSLRTVVKTRSFQLEALRQYWAMVGERQPLVGLHDGFVLQGKLLGSQMEQNSALFNLQRDLLLERTPAEEAAKRASQYFQAGHREYLAIAAERDRIWDDLESRRQTFAASNRERTFELEPLLHAVIGSIREDLELDGSSAEYVAAARIFPSELRERSASAKAAAETQEAGPSK